VEAWASSVVRVLSPGADASEDENPDSGQLAALGYVRLQDAIQDVDAQDRILISLSLTLFWATSRNCE
jgi:hypothetical protein